jgi:lipid-binding SYLF domain-containing protein
MDDSFHNSRPPPSRRLIVAGGIASSLIGSAALAQPRPDLEQNSQLALDQLYASTPKTRALSKRARGILVFPKVVKAGFMVGVQSGDGVLFERGKATGYYNVSAGSFGLQAGVQSFSYTLFFMTEKSLVYLRETKGWAFGSGPSIVVIDQGVAKTMNTTTLNQEVYAMIYGQHGLMAGLGLEGSKITRIGTP